MDKSRWFPQVSRLVFGLLALHMLGLHPSATTAQPPQDGAPASPIDREDEDFQGVFLATDRAASRGLRLARQRISEGEYGQAVDFLDDLLARAEDAFVGDARNDRQLQGLKTAALQEIGKLPLAGREAYLLATAAKAKSALQLAVERGDLQAIRSVTRRYFHTPAGYEATIILAANEDDHGRPASAAALIEQLLDTSGAVTHLGPPLYTLAAIEWQRAGRVDLAQDVLDRLRKRFPSQDAMVVAKRPIDLFSRPVDVLGQLAMQTGSRLSSEPVESENWLLFRGGSARNDRADGGMPHMNLRWRVHVANHRHVERSLDDMRQAYERRGRARLPAVHPLAVGDVVVMRTTNGLMGVDFETGLRIWTVRPDDEEPYQKLADAVRNPDAGAPSPQFVRALEARMWDDIPYGILSSDGERIYAVRGLSLDEHPELNPFQFGNPFIRQGVGTANSEPQMGPTNILSAFDLRTEGKRIWEINGADVEGPLAGAFFLNAPLPLNGRLYVLAEIRSGIHLASLSAANDWPFWKLDWIQQLANLESGIEANRLRRFAGATLSYRDGVLICPTASGAVIAVDPVGRSLLWAYRYPSHLPDNRQNVRIMVANQAAGQTEPEQRWVDGSATIEAGRVLLTPPDSSDLHCIDLASGKLIWKRPRQDGLFLAAVHEGKALFVSDHHVRAFRLADGEPAWDGRTIDLSEQTTPAGRGFLSKGQYFLPLSNQEVIAIDASDGSIQARGKSQTGSPLGNLICHRGRVLSQNERFLDSFDQLADLEIQIENALKKNGNDPEALRALAEVEFNRGNLEKALSHLRHVHDVAPDNVAVVDLLVTYLLEAVETDYAAYQDDLPFIARLADDPDQRWRLARVQAAGCEQTNDVVGAARVYLTLAKENQAAPRIRDMSPHWRTPTSRWIRAQLTALYEQGSPDERQAISQLVSPVEQALGDNPSIGKLRRHLDYFGGIGRGEELELLLASKMVSFEAGLRTEFHLLHLIESSDAKIRAHATAWLAELLHEVGRHDAARSLDDELATSFAETVCTRGRTGQEIANAHRTSYPPSHRKASIPSGSVTHNVEPISRTLSRRGLDRFHGIRMEGRIDTVLDRYLCFIDQQHRQNARGTFVLQDPTGHDEVVVPLSSDEGGRSVRDLRGKRCHAVQRGGMVVVSFGDYIMAIDALSPLAPKGDQRLWGKRVNNGLVQSQFDLLRRTRQGSIGCREFGQNGRWFATGDDKLPTGVLGPITRHGIAYQTGGRLRCVDPLTGRVQWSRGDIPIGCLLFGDDKHLFALPSNATQAIVLRALDGKRLGERTVPPIAEHLGTHGGAILCRRAANSAENKNVHEMILYDVFNETPIWSQTFAMGAKLCQSDNASIGIVEPAGRFRLISVEDGQQLIDQRIQKERSLDGVHLLLSNEDAVLLTSGSISAPAGDTLVYPVLDTDFPIVTGRVYLFDRQTGEPRWSTPAVVRRQGFARWQPRELPFVTFVSNVTRRQRSTQRLSKLLCLDRGDGRAVVFREDLKPTSGRCRIRADASDANRVHISLTAQTVHVDYTRSPRSPEPPFDEDVEMGAPKKAGGIMNLLRSLR